MSKIIGIDLGTTNSLVTVWEDGKAVCIPNAYGDFLTPSVVSFDGEEVIVGKAAKERLITAPDDTIASFKRNMGRKTLLKNKFTAAELSSALDSSEEDPLLSAGAELAVLLSVFEVSELSFPF